MKIHLFFVCVLWFPCSFATVKIWCGHAARFSMLILNLRVAAIYCVILRLHWKSTSLLRVYIYDCTRLCTHVWMYEKQDMEYDLIIAHQNDSSLDKHLPLNKKFSLLNCEHIVSSTFWFMQWLIQTIRNGSFTMSRDYYSIATAMRKKPINYIDILSVGMTALLEILWVNKYNCAHM